MPRRHWFTVSVCYDGAIEEFKFMTNGRFPFHSDVNGRIRRQWKISDDIPIFWDQVLFFPDASARSKILMKRFVCDAREYEDSQKPFLRLNNKNAAIAFSVVLGTDTFEEAELIKIRHEGKELLKALKNLDIEYDKLKSLSIKDADYISECNQKIKEATSTGNQEEVSRWSIHLSLHQKANDANLIKLAACNSERSEISGKLDARTLHYPTFRLFLESQDLIDAEVTQETEEHVDFEFDHPTSGRSVSPEPEFPPLAAIFSGIRRVPPIYPDFGELLPRITESLRKTDKTTDLHRERDSFLDVPSYPSPPPAPQATAPGPSRYDAHGQPIIPTQPSLACSLEAIATDFLPEDLRRHMGNFTPTINRLHNQFDAPYQRLWNAKNVVQNAVRDLRNLPPHQPPPTPAELELWRTPRYMLWDNPNPPASVFTPPLWTDNLMDAPEAYFPSEPPLNPLRAGTLRHSNGPAPRPTPVQPRPAPVQPQPALFRPRTAPVKPQPALFTYQYRHENISCDGCKQGIKGMRFKCKDCADFDLCSSCLLKNQRSKVHPIEHTFNTIIHRDLQRQLDKEKMQMAVVPEEHPASCDLCHKRIRGIRTKCTDCPDWDCCETCLPKLGNRHPGHTLVKINLASDLVEPPFRHPKVKHTNIICDMCQGTVVGDRWKCVHPDCDDYDLCNNCHASPLNTHPREHPILKLSAPTKIDYSSRFLRNGAKHGDHLPRRYCDFGHRCPYTPLTKEAREELKMRWTCQHHSTFELCEKSRIYHASKGALEKSSEGTQAEAGPSNRVDIGQPLENKASTDIEQPLELEPLTAIYDFAPGSHPDLIKRSEFPPSFAICPAKYDEDRCITPTIDSSLDTAAIDEFAPGSHPDIIKCYIYPPAIDICPAKYEEDRCITPTIDPSLDTETPTINPSIDTESPTNSPVADITTPSNDAIFTGVKDITIPAGCSLPVGAEFTKTWSMKHLVSGHEYKFDQLRLVHESGGLLGEACHIQLAFTQDEVKKGEKVEVSIAGLKVPDLPEQQVVEQWRFRDVDGTAYGEPLRLRFTVENPSLQNSLCNSSFIMPPPDHSSPQPTEVQAREQSRSSTSVASTPTTSQSYSSLVSLSTDADEEFAIINRVPSDQSIATDMTGDALASEFDFVDESEEAQSQT